MELLEIALLWFWYLFAVCVGCVSLRLVWFCVVLVIAWFCWFCMVRNLLVVLGVGGLRGGCLGLTILGFGWWDFGLLLFDGFW